MGAGNKVVGAVILNYNDAPTTKNLVNRIHDYKSIDHIVVVDNCSTDNSVEALRELADEKVSLIRTKMNGGYGAGNNEGVKYLVREFKVNVAIIANPDVEFTDEFAYEISCMISDEVCIASGIMLDKNNEEDATYTGKTNTYCQDLLDCTALIKKIVKTKTANFSADFVNVEYVPGSLFAIDANAFIQLGGFDENVFLYCEERILGNKVLNARKKIVLNRRISYKHLHSVSINKSMKLIKQIKQLYRSRLYYWKNYKKVNLFNYYILCIVMQYGILLRNLYCKFAEFQSC